MPHALAQIPEVICAVEDGWAGMRTFSLDVARKGQDVLVLIAEQLEPQVLAMITTPPHMRVAAVPRPWFRWRLITELLQAALRGRLRSCVVTKARTQRLVGWLARACGARIIRLCETVEGYRLEGDACASR